jgi:DNA invertase Pin-like site-specific DNA recombinase
MVKRRKAPDPKRAVAYLRTSTTEQRLSIEAQRAGLEAWAAREGVHVALWCVDEGVSGSTPLEARPALVEALAALRPHDAGVLLILRRDRLARDHVEAGLIERAVLRQGARVLSTDGGGNGTSPADAFMRAVLDAASAHERAVLRQRTSAALQAKIARGERAGQVPYGYRLASDGKRLEADPVEQGTIARILALHAAGRSLRAIEAELAHEGVVSRGRRGEPGKPLSHVQVRRILQRHAPAT